ncbi:MAG: hypothetical protein ACO3AV_13260 [Ilumatobacteraceae bacterium]
MLAPARTIVASLLALSLVSACSSGDEVTYVRAADDVQVMDPDDVAGARPDLVSGTTLPPGSTVATDDSTDSNDGSTVGTDAAGETVPQNTDDRPPEIRLFEAFGKFRACLEDKGYGIEGDLTNPNNPAYQDPAYADAVGTCAARTDIVAVLQEVQSTRANLTPEQVEQRNEVFVVLQECLEAKGWTVETTTSEIGLLEPAVFQNADGVLDERDINQCLSEQELG